MRSSSHAAATGQAPEAVKARLTEAKRNFQQQIIDHIKENGREAALAELLAPRPAAEAARYLVPAQRNEVPAPYGPRGGSSARPHAPGQPPQGRTL
ncbi:hypothetical protein [Micromonospora sp. SH-82]|uniref:hypothetical protein n=1 Tax=Micromonospora sp. SH-82 TaxID=3132938 RepID=UPI003EB82352